MKIKRIIALLLAIIVVASFVSCSKEEDENDDTTAAVTTEEVTTAADETTGNPEQGDLAVETTSLLSIPTSSEVRDDGFAFELLSICRGGDANSTAELFNQFGYQVNVQANYGKTASDRSHTSAYTVGSAYGKVNGKVRKIVLINVRGTSEGEWYSNFNVAISSKDPVYAENFLYAADDVLIGAQCVLADIENPVVIVCGYSRGAAVANLLGTMLDNVYPASDVYAYTFATPATVRGAKAEEVYTNIFNYINPADLVTKLPVEAWGYKRAGTDIILGADEAAIAQTNAVVNALVSIAPDIDTYYNTKYLLNGEGTGTSGLAPYDLMLLFAGILASGTTDLTGLSTYMAMVSPQSTLYPVIITFAGGDFNSVLSQHMPQVYVPLIQNASK